MFDVQHNSEVYCWLKTHLAPRYQVIAEPQPGYFAEQLYCYRVFDGEELLHELTGDFRQLAAGELVAQAEDIVRRCANRQQGAA